MFATTPEAKFAKAFQPRESSDLKFMKSAATMSASPAKEDRASPPLTGTEAEGIVVIGRGTHIIGDLFDCSMIEIQGTVEGRISTTMLVIREGGTVNGEVHADAAEIHGRLDGHVAVTNTLDVRSTGCVAGEVTYGKLAVAMGGNVFGNINITKPLLPLEPAASEALNDHPSSTLMGISVLRPSSTRDALDH
jgi:cytoskeletal protein CcmA (bactofilin family)